MVKFYFYFNIASISGNKRGMKDLYFKDELISEKGIYKNGK